MTNVRSDARHIVAGYIGTRQTLLEAAIIVEAAIVTRVGAFCTFPGGNRLVLTRVSLTCVFCR